MYNGRRNSLVRVGSYITPPPTNKSEAVLETNLNESDPNKLIAASSQPSWEQGQQYSLAKQNDKLLSELCVLWKNDQLCDVILSVEKATFKAHKTILAASSKYLREMFIARGAASGKDVCNEVTKIPLLGIHADTVQSILDGIYTSSIYLNKKNVDDILSAASFLKIPSITEACERFLCQFLTTKNCLRTLQVANLYDLKTLLDQCNTLASTNFNLVCQQKEFLKLRYCELRCLIVRQDLNAPSEIFIFDALVRWIDADKTTRVIYAGRLMGQVRFSLIPESELVDKVESSQFVCQIPEVSELVREAVRYHLLPYRRSIMQNSRTVPRTTTKLDVIVGCGGLALQREGSLTDKVFFCNLNTGKWEPFAQLPEARHHHAVATMGRFLYVAGGDSTEGCRTPSKQAWRYDTWSEEWLNICNMTTPRESFQLVALDSKLYAIGGRTTQGFTVSGVEVYNPGNNTWSPGEPISSARRHIAATPFNGRIYTAGGSSDDLVSRRVERYSPAIEKWERRQPLVRPRFSASLHAIEGRLWLVGGATVDPTDPGLGIQGTNQIEVYTPGNNQWIALTRSLNCDEQSLVSVVETDLVKWEGQQGGLEGCDPVGLSVAVSRSEAGSCTYAGKVFLVGGYSWLNRGRIDNVECIDLAGRSLAINESERNEGLAEKEPHDTVEKTQPNIPSLPNYEKYPLRCTGMACATLTLFKNPSLIDTTRNSAICVSEDGHNDDSATRDLASSRASKPETKSANPTGRKHQQMKISGENYAATGTLPNLLLHRRASSITSKCKNPEGINAPPPTASPDFTGSNGQENVSQWLTNNQSTVSLSTQHNEKLNSDICELHGDGDQGLYESSNSIFLTQ